MSRFFHLSRRKHHPWVCSTSCCIHRCICCVRIILSCCYCSCLKQSKSEIRCLQFAHLCCCILFRGEEQVHDHGGSNRGPRSLHWGLDRVLFIFYSNVFLMVCASLGVFITLSWQSNVLRELFSERFLLLFHQTLLLTLLVWLRLVCNAGWQLDRECAEVGAGKMAWEVAWHNKILQLSHFCSENQTPIILEVSTDNKQQTIDSNHFPKVFSHFYVFMAQ